MNDSIGIGEVKVKKFLKRQCRVSGCLKALSHFESCSVGLRATDS